MGRDPCLRRPEDPNVERVTPDGIDVELLRRPKSNWFRPDRENDFVFVDWHNRVGVKPVRAVIRPVAQALFRDVRKL